jgi:rubrerythrin
MLQISAAAELDIQNLLTAYEHESNTQARYTDYAAKADEEGLHGIASLFRAAARAEHILAANHARVMKQLGEEAWFHLHPAEVKSTLENLKTALAGEQHEIDTMYPGFAQDAQIHRNTFVLRTFTGAIEAERTHARLYRAAIAAVEAGKPSSWIWTEREFYVCPVCAYTTEIEEEQENCPVCNATWERFEIIR